MTELPGLDLAVLGRWLDVNHPGLRQGPLTAGLLTGGKSNLTYRVSDGSSMWALRRPPLGHALATAHDMPREYRVMSALRGTPVPVAETVVLCEDSRVLGAPFYLMSFVEGIVLDEPHGLDLDDARSACELLIDTLLALHAIDPDDVGLGDLGRPSGFLQRQLRRWSTQWRASETQPRPLLEELVKRLTTTVPIQTAPGLVHGDYRLTNLIYAADMNSIAAVVDWEMATLGDPLSDVGLLVVYQSLSNDGAFVMPKLGVGDGFLAPASMVARYAASSSRPLDSLDWYVSFGYFKLAVIAEGIHQRHLQGKTVGEGFSELGIWVPYLLDAAMQSASELRADG